MTATHSCLEALKAQAIAARKANSAEARIANALPTFEQRTAAYQAMTKPFAQCGAVVVEALIPQNRTAWRAAHIRLRFRVAGKVVPESVAASTLMAAQS